jgi:hypothetical protein
LLERINLTIEQKSLPLYDVGASFRLTRNNHPQIKYKDGFQDLIIQILTVLKNGLIPKISLFYQEGNLGENPSLKLFVGPARRTTSVKTL